MAAPDATTKKRCAKKGGKAKALAQPKKTTGKTRGRVRAKKAAKPKVVERDDGQLSARHEHFATLYASGTVTARDAYLAAFGEVKGVDQSASRLLSSAKVAARVKAIQTESASGRTLTLRHKREYLYRVVTTAIGEVREDSDLCQAHKSITSDSGGSEEYKMPDKLRAIELDAKLAGELREEVKVEAGDGLAALMIRIRNGHRGATE